MQAAVSDTITYQGRLLASPSTPAASMNFDMRFSLWADADFVDGVDRDGSGALVGTTWEEELAMTTDSQGFFIVEVGSVTALPEFDFTNYKYLQAEVKVSGAADTTYFVLDNKAADTAIDRKALDNSAYAQNALRLDGRQLGFTAGNIPYLDAQGKLDRNLITDDSWLDPVADATALAAIASPASGDVVFVISEGRLYTYTGSQWDVVDDAADAAISVLDSRMDTAEANISSNDTDIAANLAAIQSNDTDIAANLAAIQSNDTDIATNATDIATNATDIATNVSDISALDTRVTTNESDIAQNAADIAANLGASDWKEAVATVGDLATTYPTAEAGWSAYVTGESEIYSYNGTAWVKVGAANLAAIQSNDTDIAALDTRLTTAESDIVTNATDIASNLAAIQSNDTDIATNATNITTNAGAIAQNATDISTNATDIATNATAIASNDTDIAANLAAIQSNDTDIAALDTRVTTNEGDISTNATNIATNATDIANLESFSSASFDVFILP